MPTTLRTDGNYCAYLRKSRRDVELEAQGGGETLARHERALGELAARLGIAISYTYREVVSGDTIAERPEVRRLLDAVNCGAWDGVLVMDVDRLGRGDSIDQGIIMQSFMYAGVPLITPDKIYDPTDDSDAEFFEIKLFFSRREYNMIKKRMQRGRLASVMDGCYMGSRPVYGYERVKLKGRKGWTLQIVPEKAAIVRAVFAWYAYGMDGQQAGGGTISARLNEMGLRTDLGNAWTPNAVRHMLQNPAYIGKVQWNQRVTTHRIHDGERVKSREKSDAPLLVDGLHEPIIDMELWERVQRMFATHEKRPKNQGAPLLNPFAGLMRCGVCGRSMFRVPDPSRRGDFLRCMTQGCPTCRTYLSVVEDAVLHMLNDWVSELEALPAELPSADAADAAAAAVALASLREQRDIVTGQINRLCDLLEQGIYSLDLYQQRQALLSAQLNELDEAIARQESIPRPDPRVKLLPRLRTVLDSYPRTADAGEKNVLLRSVIDHIDYHKTQRCFRNNAPGDNLTLDIYPRIPDDD